MIDLSHAASRRDLLLIGVGGLARLFAAPATPVAALLTPGTPVSLTITNDGHEPDRLIGAESDIATRIELRRREGFGPNQHDVILPGGIDVPAGSVVILEPLGDHLALIGLKVPLVQGHTFSLRLRFERAGEVDVTGRVRRKLDAAGVMPIPATAIGDLVVTLVSAPPAPMLHPAATPVAPTD